MHADQQQFCIIFCDVWSFGAEKVLFYFAEVYGGLYLEALLIFIDISEHSSYELCGLWFGLFFFHAYDLYYISFDSSKQEVKAKM